MSLRLQRGNVVSGMKVAKSEFGRSVGDRGERQSSISTLGGSHRDTATENLARAHIEYTLRPHMFAFHNFRETLRPPHRHNGSAPPSVFVFHTVAGSTFFSHVHGCRKRGTARMPACHRSSRYECLVHPSILKKRLLSFPCVRHPTISCGVQKARELVLCLRK